MKIITLLFFLSITFLKGQNIDYLQKLNELDSTQVYEVANDLISLQRNEYKLIGYYNSDYGKDTFIIYYPKNEDPYMDENFKSRGLYCDKCLEVRFSYYFKGENKDLEMIGQKKWAFREIHGKYLDLFPWYEKYVTPGLSSDKLLEDYEARHFIDRKLKLKFYLEKNIDGSAWQIINRS